MAENIVVLGAGYAGTGAIKSLEQEIDGDASVTWISDTDYHFVLHESHRCIRDPTIKQKVTIPIQEIKKPSTSFIQAEVTGVDTNERTVELNEAESVEFDYLLVALGTQTAFFGIDGLEEYAHTLKNLDDVLDIHNAIKDAAHKSSHSEPAQVVIGGAGLSGIQIAGEVAEYRDHHSAPLDICLVEGLDEILPKSNPELQESLRKHLETCDIDIKCGEFIDEVNEDVVSIGGKSELEYDVLIWTGGITGRSAVQNIDLDTDERNSRIYVEEDFQTEDNRIFAIGDSALINQPGDQPAPPTAQAAWQAAEVAGKNLARAMRDQPLQTWTHNDKGTVVSIGEKAVAHNVMGVPITTFSGFPARVLKKSIAASWIADITSVSRAVMAWADM